MSRGLIRGLILSNQSTRCQGDRNLTSVPIPSQQRSGRPPQSSCVVIVCQRGSGYPQLSVTARPSQLTWIHTRLATNLHYLDHAKQSAYKIDHRTPIGGDLSPYTMDKTPAWWIHMLELCLFCRTSRQCLLLLHLWQHRFQHKANKTS